MPCVKCGDNNILPDGDCSTPEVCSGFESTDCIIYTGVDLPDISISNGDRLSVVLKKLLEIATNFEPCTTTSTTTLPTTTTSTSSSTTTTSTTVAPTTTSTTIAPTTSSTTIALTTSTTTVAATTSTTTVAPTTTSTTTVAATTTSTTTVAPTTTSTTTSVPGYQYYTLKTVNCGNCVATISSIKAVAYDKILTTGSYFKIQSGQYAGVYIIDLVLDPNGSLPQLDISGYTIFTDQNACTDACNF